jgi:hypothetical protein
MIKVDPFAVFKEVYAALGPEAFRDSEGNYDFTEAELMLTRVRDAAVLQRLALAATQLAGMAAVAHGNRVMLEQRRRTGTFGPGDLVAGRRATENGEGGALVSGTFSSWSASGERAFLKTTLHNVLAVERESLRHIGDDGVMVPLPEVGVTA